MTLRYQQALKAVGLVCLLPLSLSAILASATEARVGPLDEIVVTATRRATSADDVSNAVSVIGQESIAQSAALTDALANQPGVFLQQTTPGQGAAVVRGLKGSAILHMVDGVRLNNALFRSAPTQYLSLVPGVAAERIELLSGTPASLYGSDAIGGVVQVITRTPTFNGDEIELRGDNTLSYDSADLMRLIQSSVDVGNEQAAASLSAEWQRTGTRRTGDGTRLAFGDYESFGGRALFMLTPTDSRTWKLDLQYMEQPETPRVDELIAGFGETEPASSEYFFAPNRRLFAHASVEEFESAFGLDWRVDLSWQRIDDDRVTRNLNADTRRRESNSSDLFGLSATVSRDEGSYNWIAGVEVYDDRVSSSRREESLASGIITDIAARFPDGAGVTQAALFANLSTDIGRQHTLSGGLRITRAAIDLPSVAGNPASDFTVNDLSGDVGWLWRIDSNWQVVANLGAGFRAPNIFDLGTLGNRPGNRFNIPNTQLDAENVVHVDAGFRYSGERASFSFTAFSLQYDDRIVSVATGDLTTGGRQIVQSTNAAKADITGVEASAAWEISGELSAQLSVSQTRGEQRIAGGMTEPSDRIPPLTGRLVVDWQAPAGGELSAWLNFASDQDRLSNSDIGDSRIDPDGTPGWAVVGMSWRQSLTDNWEVQLAADNLLDKRYRLHGSGLDARGRGLSVSVAHQW